jgi:hypothetical protein
MADASTPPVRTTTIDWKTLVDQHKAPEDDDKVNPPIVYWFGNKRAFTDKRDPAVVPD